MKKEKELYLPCLRGLMGDWIYYVCLMKLGEVAKRITFAEIIHKNKSLSDMIQRKLIEGRGREIRDYLLSNQERFFNSMIVAVYGGDPSWYELGKISSKHKELSELDDNVMGGIGILRLNGGESLYALDGQHRLAGIKQAISSNKEMYDEDISIIFVAHKNNKKGFERSRRLFTVLNKTAKPVSKGEIIALDEDDVMAILTRRLIENTNLFSGDRISYQRGNNIPPTNKTSLTTIENLYDLVEILLTKILYTFSKAQLRSNRPPDSTLDEYFSACKKFFDSLFATLPSLKAYVGETYVDAVCKFRNKNGGSVLYRPIGLSVIFGVIAKLRNKYSVSDCIKMVSKLPTDLSEVPYRNVIWHPTKKTIINKGKSLCTRLLLYMLMEEPKKEKLLADYRKYLGEGFESEVLPKQIK